MRPALALIAATTALAFTAPAFAQAQSDQGPGANQAPSASQTLNPTTGAGAPPVPGDATTTGKTTPAPVGSASNTSATLPAIPSDWGGDARDWTLHTAACAKAYPNYDQTTDHFRTPEGRSQKCALAMGKGAVRKR
jgi:hypothetical protein